MSTQIGWAITKLDYAIKQGSSGAQRLTMKVTQDDGSALPSYDGWTAEIKLDSPFSRTAAITLAPDVVGDAVAMTFTVDLVFTTALTENLKPGAYVGDLVMLDADLNREYPANITLTIQESYAP